MLVSQSIAASLLVYFTPQTFVTTQLVRERNLWNSFAQDNVNPVVYLPGQIWVRAACKMWLAWLSRSTVPHEHDLQQLQSEGCGDLRIRCTFCSTQKRIQHTQKTKGANRMQVKQIKTIDPTKVRTKMKAPPQGLHIVLRLQTGNSYLLA